MTKRYRNLIGKITARETMQTAYRLTSRGKRLTAGYLDFKEFDALNLAQLAREMAEGRYAEGEPHQFHVFDPKRRLISALPFRDRVAQQALCLVIAPIFDRALLPRSFACRPGKGTHAGVVLLQSELRRESRGGPLYFLKTDFSAYFASIERTVLWRLIEAKISCRATLRLIEAMVPRARHRPADRQPDLADLRQPLHRRHARPAPAADAGRGLTGIATWTTSWCSGAVARICAMSRTASRTSRASSSACGSRNGRSRRASRGINFLGYRIWATHKLLRRDSVSAGAAQDRRLSRRRRP